MMGINDNRKTKICGGYRINPKKRLLSDGKYKAGTFGAEGKYLGKAGSL